MTQNRDQKSLRFLKTIIIILIILIIFLIVKLLGEIFVIPKIKQEATLYLIQQCTSSKEEAKQLIYNMTEEDIEAMEEIIDQTISPSDISTLSNYALNKDYDSLKQYAKDNLSSANKEKLLQLYEKYKNSVP